MGTISRSSSALEAASEGEDGWWRGFSGSPEPDRIYAGLWALHLRRIEDGLSAHHLIGI